MNRIMLTVSTLLIVMFVIVVICNIPNSDNITPIESNTKLDKDIEKQKMKKHETYDKYKDRRFHVKYASIGDRSIRYGALEEAPIFKNEYLQWDGKRHLTVEQMDILVRAVYKRLPHIRTTDESVALMIETIIAESDGGTDIINKYGDLGVCQIKVSTSLDLQKWLKVMHPDILDAIYKFKNSKLSEKDNLLKNIPYSIAVGITYYWRMVGAEYHKHITTLTDRGVMWKSKYNTYKGYGTVYDFVRRVNNYKRVTEFVALD